MSSETDILRRKIDRLQKNIIELEQNQAILYHDVELIIHTLQTNLQGILTDAELINYSLESSNVRMDRLRDDAKSLLDKLYITILNSNYTTSNLGHYVPCEVKVGVIVRQAVDTFDGMARDRGISINFQSYYSQNGPICRASPRHLHHAVHNIIHNAVKYSYSRSGSWSARTVDVILKPHQQTFWLLKVVNYGVPIDPDELEKIRNKTVRGRHSGDRQRPGSGFGLYFTNEIVKRHKGILDIESKRVEGGAGVTTVTMCWPIKAEI